SEAGEVKLLDFSLAKLVDVPSLGRLRGNTFPPEFGRGPLTAFNAGPTPLAPEASDGEGPKEQVPKDNLSDTVTLPGPPGAGAPAPAERDGWRAGRAEITAVGALVGTPHYMAPELWRGEPASRASDVYALGVLLYCLCCGQPPTEAATMIELAE